ncbi:MAG: Ig protein [Acidobacteriaceae bacterium]|nr:Ig protein [Acidobacteriaceae bacterium]
MTIYRNISNLLTCAATVAMMLVLTSCGGSSSDPTTVSTIVVIPSVSSTTVNGHQAFTANALNSDGNSVGTVTLTWTSSDTNVATIDGGGMATGKNGGTTQIIATATSNGVTSSAVSLTVFPTVASVSIAPINVAVKVGQQQQFTATAKDVNGNNIGNAVFNWSSSFSGVASIDTNGKATGISPGTVLVTASIGGVSSPMATLNVTP